MRSGKNKQTKKIILRVVIVTETIKALGPLQQLLSHLAKFTLKIKLTSFHTNVLKQYFITERCQVRIQF